MKGGLAAQLCLPSREWGSFIIRVCGSFWTGASWRQEALGVLLLSPATAVMETAQFFGAVQVNLRRG